jgi:two-component system, chemotaxis family, protein-glutamate methylesterase/glutaminase
MATTQKQIAVMIVEDSDTVRALLTRIVRSDPRLRLVGAVASGEAALDQLDDLAPDVISMDIELPGIDGIETTRLIMSIRPTPVVIVSSHIGNDSAARAIQALGAGAVALIEKPSSEKLDGDTAMASRLADQLVAMSSVRLVQQRFNVPPTSFVGAARRLRCQITPVVPAGGGALGIVASTGGPRAILSVLAGLPLDFPMPILIVQHIGAEFTHGFVEWLANTGRFPASIATEGTVPARGRIYVAPGNCHLTIDAGRIRLEHGSSVDGHRPSGTVMLTSLAKQCGASAIGVVLTGMGEDGARGLAAMRDAGAWTIAQDESTSVVYGMPAVAAKLEAACEILPLSSIPGAVRVITNRRSGVHTLTGAGAPSLAKPIL